MTSTFALIDDVDLKRWLKSDCRLYTNLDGEKPGGSIKDHMVSGELEALRASGQLSRDKIIAEASAGSTAKSLAYYCNKMSVPCALFVPDTLSPQALAYLRSQRADVHAVSIVDGFERYATFCARPGVIPFNQMKVHRKRRHYHQLGAAIERHFCAESRRAEGVIGAVGTGHSLIGVAEGMSHKPKMITAEPVGVEVSGIRNIDVVRYGDDDPCVPGVFDQRILVNAADFYQGSKLNTNLGQINFADSFRVALGAAAKLLATSKQYQSLFILGATNARVE